MVFLDLDGVLVDFVKGACALHGVENPYAYKENHGNYSLESLIKMQPEKFWRAMGHAFWANLEWMPDGKKILQMVLDHVNGEQITLLTSPIKTPGCLSGKMEWIEREMPSWNRRFLIGPGKHAIAAPGKLLIDDYDSNIDKWINHGGPAIQVPRPMNRLHEESTLSYVKAQLEIYFT